MNKFVLKSKYSPAGDQPAAIEKLVKGLEKGYDKQTLLGVTGSGKTFTVANVIEKVQKPTLVIAHNKTLAAQLASEFREFFPDAAVHYFVSYYDYYQPEAYVAATDTFIEKDAQINEEIDRLRHASTQSLLTRKDVIIVASVSCIYGLGSPVEYFKNNFVIRKDEVITKRDIMLKLVSLQFDRTTADLKPGTFRSIGNSIEIMPVQERTLYRLELLGSKIMSIIEIDPVTSIIKGDRDSVIIFPTKHFLMDEKTKETAIKNIKQELKTQLAKFEKEGKLLEAERLKRRTTYDMAMLKEVGYCSGIENYSRQLSGKEPGAPPETLISYFGMGDRSDFLTVIDESHVTISQLGAMYAGDRSRKENLVEYGFRLPSALDNRPLRSEEFWERVGQTIFVSATPGKYEAEFSKNIVEQIIRPTGLIDPEIIIRPVTANANYAGQIQDFILEAESIIKNGGRVLATTLTKRMAEDLSTYLKERDIKAEYLHSDVLTMDRVKILTKLRRGEVDILVGVNLLREGLDLPEVTLVGILDADKQGFLRSVTSLIQTIGRAARNVEGKVILYADVLTDSMDQAISETNRRRTIQVAHNKKYNITPITISKTINDITDMLRDERDKSMRTELETDLAAFGGNVKKLITQKKQDMEAAAELLDFETAAILRDEIKELEGVITRQDKAEKKEKAEKAKGRGYRK